MGLPIYRSFTPIIYNLHYAGIITTDLSVYYGTIFESINQIR